MSLFAATEPKPCMKLRSYQQEGVNKAVEGFEEVRKLLWVVPTGGGKTIMFSKLAADWQGRCLILAHRDELIDQARDKLWKSTGCEADKEKAESYASLDSRIVVGSVQTLCREKRLSRWPKNHFDLVVVDECFPAHTLVDGRRIADLKIGDFVYSFNHATQTVEQKPVTHVFKSRPISLVRVSLSGGGSIVCTAGHPFFTSRGYIPALRLTSKDVVYSIMSYENNFSASEQMRAMLEGLPVREKATASTIDGETVLLKAVQSRLRRSNRRREHGCDQSEIRLGTHEKEQSNEQASGSRENENHASSYGLEAVSAAGQRAWTDRAATSSSVCVGLADGIGDLHEPTAKERLSDLLQAGYRQHNSENRDRGGWSEPRTTLAAVTRQKESLFFSELRVDCVEILEQTSDGRFGGLCPDGFVYNLEVEGNNNYFAGGILVHNCHHILAESYQRVLTHFDEHACVLGVTATPDRGDKKNLGKYFEKLCYEISLLELINQGFLSRIKIKSLPIQIDLSGVKTIAGDYDAGELDTRIGKYLVEIAKAIKEHASWRKTLVFLPLCKTSEAMAAACRAIGLSAEHIQGDSPDRAEILKRFHKSETDILCNAALLNEGFDCPDIDCIIVLRPTQVRALYSQMVGRGTRIAPGKTELLLLDFLWLHEKHELIKPAHLIAPNAAMADAMTKISEKQDAPVDLEGLRLLAEKEEEDRLEKESETKRQREAKLIDRIKENQGRGKKYIDAMQYSLSLHDSEGATYEPAFGWESDPASDKQLAALANMGIEPGTVTCKGLASRILDQAITRRKLGLATPKQLMLLRRFKAPDANTVTFEEASKLIDGYLNKPRFERRENA